MDIRVVFGNACHVDGAADADSAGDVEGGRRYRFVDTRDRGELQPYVVESAGRGSDGRVAWKGI